MKLKGILGHQTAFVFDHSTTLSCLLSACCLLLWACVGLWLFVCQRMLEGSFYIWLIHFSAIQHPIPRDYPTNDWRLMQHSSV